jgi:phenylpropionate dioxygenase-like ring-hydroxylating dioxygenase large terminal subunit
MLSREENNLICRTGPGTPMGDLLRRFWMPAALSEELEPDGEPLRLMIMSEPMVAFRDTSGKVGILERQCPHRLADMWFGRNEEHGLACAYHGWKFDTSGACVDMPTETAESNYKHKVRMRSYGVEEFGGLIWVYMGPPEQKPELPQMEWLRVPASQRIVTRWLQESNYLQAVEGDIDSAHISFNHRFFQGLPDPGDPPRGISLASNDGAPRLTVKETDYGFIYGSRREIDGGYYWRCTQMLLPFFSLIPSAAPPWGGHCWVPVDDTHSMAFQYTGHPERAFTQEEIDRRRNAPLGNSKCTYELPDGNIIDTWRGERTRQNDYKIDRNLQKTFTYTGILNIREQDMAMTDGMGMIPERWREHLGTTDLAIIAYRRILLRLAKELQRGIEPFAPHHGGIYHVRPIDVLSDEGDFNAVYEQNKALAVAKA